MIKNIIFDIGNVLVDFRDHDYMRDLGFSDELTELFCEKIVFNPLWNELDRGVRAEEDVIREMTTFVPGCEKEAGIFFANLREIVKTRNYAKPWLQELKEKGYGVYLLSNYPKSLFEIHSKDRFDFLEAVDGMVVSAYVKMIKPDSGIYRCLMQKYGLKPEECVFLDDRQENVDAAISEHMQGILFTDYASARTQLEEMLKRRGLRKRK